VEPASLWAQHTRHAAAGLATRRKGIDTGVKRRLWELSALVSGMAAAAACRKLMTVLWRVSRNEDPPGNPAARHVRWRDALVWSISLGVGAGVSRLVAERGAAAAWEVAVGSRPPGLDEAGD
jgi:hypothetical protein